MTIIMANIEILQIFLLRNLIPHIMLPTFHKNVSNCILWNLLCKQRYLSSSSIVPHAFLSSIQSHSNDIILQLPEPFVHNQWNSMRACQRGNAVTATVAKHMPSCVLNMFWTHCACNNQNQSTLTIHLSHQLHGFTTTRVINGIFQRATVAF